MKHLITLTIASAAMIAALPANAASSDYYLTIEGVAGETAVTGDIQGYSWGMTNTSSAPTSGASGREMAMGQAAGSSVTAPRDLATGQASGKRMHKPMTVLMVSGDLDGDGVADLSDTASVDQIDSFTLIFDKASPVLARMCGPGTKFNQATIKMRTASFTVAQGAVTSCATANTAGKVDVNSMPNRISTNVTVPRQTQSTSFGDRCAAGACAAPEMVAVTITGQLKHTKTGHVTLMK